MKTTRLILIALLVSIPSIAWVSAETQPSDAALPATELDVMATAEAAGSFDTLLAAAEATGLDETLRAEGTFTLFAPTDEAFAALAPEVLARLLDDPNSLEEILLGHLVPGIVQSGDLDGEQLLTTALGSSLQVSHGTDGSLAVGEARVVAADIPASNGVIHVIDTVLSPGS
jgi:uncharacterized surface protein with fasciclin (FAS1) repeats